MQSAILLVVGGYLAFTLAQIDTTNLADGTYNILHNGMALAARDNGFEWQYLGNVTLELKNNSAREQMWRLNKAIFYPDQGPYQLRFINSLGAYGFNKVDVELPRPGSFPVNHYWRLENVTGKVMINSRLQFDWDEIGDNKCLQTNGVDSVVTFEECDEDNNTQKWDFVLYQ